MTEYYHSLLTSPIKGEGFTPIPPYSDTRKFCGPLPAQSHAIGVIEGRLPALKALISFDKPQTQAFLCGPLR